MSDAKVLALAPRPETKKIVSLLEELLEHAKKGELLSVAVAAQMAAGETMSAHAHEDGASMGALFLALERTKKRIIGE